MKKRSVLMRKALKWKKLQLIEVVYYLVVETPSTEGAVDASTVYVASWFIGKLAFTTSRPPPWKMEAGLWHRGQMKWPNISFFDGLELRVLHEYLEAGLDDLPKQYLNIPWMFVFRYLVLPKNMFLVSFWISTFLPVL